MSMFRCGSDCSGPCIVCVNHKGCLAGRGDDDFKEADKKELKRHFVELGELYLKTLKGKKENFEVSALLQKQQLEELLRWIEE